MKISVLSGLFGRFQTEKIFELVSACGFDGIELCGMRPHAYPYDMDSERVANILRLCEKYNLEISMYTPELLMYPYNIASPLKKEREDSVEYVIRSIQAAKDLGTPRVQLTCGHANYLTDKQESLNNVVECLKPICEEAEKKEIDIILECLTIMESNTIVMLDTFNEIADRVGSDRLCSMLDSAMVFTNWEPVDDYFTKLGDKLKYVHWGDNNGISERHLEYGKGRIDPEVFFDMIHRRGYDGWVSLEMYGEYIREPEMHAGREARMLKKLFEKYK